MAKSKIEIQIKAQKRYKFALQIFKGTDKNLFLLESCKKQRTLEMELI